MTTNTPVKQKTDLQAYIDNENALDELFADVYKDIEKDLQTVFKGELKEIQIKRFFSNIVPCLLGMSNRNMTLDEWIAWEQKENPDDPRCKDEAIAGFREVVQPLWDKYGERITHIHAGNYIRTKIDTGSTSQRDTLDLSNSVIRDKFIKLRGKYCPPEGEETEKN